MADITFEITSRNGKAASGTLSWPAKGLTSAAVSGSSQTYDALEVGSYTAKRSKLLDKPNQQAYCDTQNPQNCWLQALDANFTTSRTDLGIHPDGNVPGTAGCIGLKVANTKPWYDAFYAVPANSSVSVEITDSTNFALSQHIPQRSIAHGRSRASESSAAIGLLTRFRWPLITVVFSVMIGTLGACPYIDKTGGYEQLGLYEKFYNSAIVTTAGHFWQISGSLFVITFFAAAVGPAFRWLWNRRLADYVLFLESAGRDAEAKSAARRVISATRWIQVQAVLLLLLGLVAYVGSDFKTFGRNAAILRGQKEPTQVLSSLDPFKRNCFDCTASAFDDAQVDKAATLMPVAEQGNGAASDSNGTVCRHQFALTIWTPSESFLLAIFACFGILALEWLGKFAAFLFIGSTDDSDRLYTLSQ